MLTANYILDWVSENGGYRLWKFDPHSRDPLPGSPVQQGTWQTIHTGHELIALGSYILDWVPETGGYRLWKFDPESRDPLPDPMVQGGAWGSIRTGHSLIA